MVQSVLTNKTQKENNASRSNALIKKFLLHVYFPQDNEELKSTIAPGSKSLLPTPIQELIKMIFDVESMKKTLVEFEVSEKSDGKFCSRWH